MSILNGLPVNFIFSEDAVREIERMRALLKAGSASSADVLSVGWGFFKPKGFPDFEAPALGFYGDADRESLAGGIEIVSGIEVFFFILKEHHSKFAGKVLDFSAERMFFLREP
ncbi:MAG: hypothetical protein ABWZ80_04890 [Beijerinckiaceae bacterium]